MKKQDLDQIRDILKEELASAVLVQASELSSSIKLNKDSVLLIEVDARSICGDDRLGISQFMHHVQQIFYEKGIGDTIVVEKGLIKIKEIDSSKKVEYLE